MPMHHKGAIATCAIVPVSSRTSLQGGKSAYRFRYYRMCTPGFYTEPTENCQCMEERGQRFGDVGPQENES